MLFALIHFKREYNCNLNAQFITDIQTLNFPPYIMNSYSTQLDAYEKLLQKNLIDNFQMIDWFLKIRSLGGVTLNMSVTH